MKQRSHLIFDGVLLVLCGVFAAGCTTESRARSEAHDAYLAGQNAALQQAKSASEMPTISIVGPVQNPKVPWVAGMTLLQALATANYLEARQPRKIVITRNGESAALDPQVLFNGAVVPLEAGDVIELRP